MFLHLHNLTIHLQSKDDQICQSWRHLFNGWLLDESPTPPADFGLELALAASLPAPPKSTPLFDDRSASPDRAGILTVYGSDESFLLYFRDGAFVEVPLSSWPVARVSKATGWLTRNALSSGRFEDITFTSLAPLLRRRRYFLIHAFAAARNNQAILIVGPSGSGKTTTGLSLLLAGWELLANDVVLVQPTPDGIYALPTPGAIGIRPQTLELLPGLREMITGLPTGPMIDITDSLHNFVNWARPTRVTAVYFPQIVQQASSEIRFQNRAVGLAQLMTESIDQWDAPYLQTHMTLLQNLCQQAKTYALHLGQDVDNLPVLLNSER